jgi:hypothetical protein
LREELVVMESDAATGQQVFSGMAELWRGQEIYEYAVLVTSLSEEVLGVAQLYRDRAEAENAFDELKNQWGWTGFATVVLGNSIYGLGYSTTGFSDPAHPGWRGC